MSKYYEEPVLVVKKLDINHNIFTDSGDRIDDDVYDITGNASGDPEMNVFGD